MGGKWTPNAAGPCVSASLQGCNCTATAQGTVPPSGTFAMICDKTTHKWRKAQNAAEKKNPDAFLPESFVNQDCKN
jgi:hypothetical protein